MNIKTKAVKGNGYSIILSEATYLQALRRERLKSEASAFKDTEIELRIARILTYPDIVAATRETEGFENWPPSFEELCNWPALFVEKLEEAVYELNPHWRPGWTEEQREDKKKKEEKTEMN